MGLMTDLLHKLLRECRRFKMYRRNVPAATHDENQRNAPDQVQFEGVQFSDGRVAVHWLTAKRSTSIWDSMEDMLAIHGHPEYESELVWIDAALAEPQEQNVAPQPSTADQDTAPSQEGVGQGEAASATPPVEWSTSHIEPFLSKPAPVAPDCTCHPDDYPPVPCQHKRSYSECMRAALASAQAEIAALKRQGSVSVPRKLLVKLLMFLMQDCTPCAAEDCQIDNKNIGVDGLVNELKAMLSASGEGKP